MIILSKWTERGQELEMYRVQVPPARGSVIPEMDSISEDLPALWFPTTTIRGRSMSTWTLQNRALKSVSSVKIQVMYPVL